MLNSLMMPEIRASRSSRGFTLVELLVVVGMIVLVSFLAVRIMSRRGRGHAPPVLGRTLLARVHQARQTTMASSRPTRLTVQPTVTGTKIVSEWQTVDGNWVQLDALEPSPSTLLLCDPINSSNVVSPTPTCPATTTTVIQFSKNSATCGPNHWFACVTSINGATPNPINGGATLFFSSVDGAKQY